MKPEPALEEPTGGLAGMRRRLTKHLRGALPRWKEGERQAEGAKSSHIVQFYAGGFPAEHVAEFVQAGLDLGEAAVVICTPTHERAVRRRLRDTSRITFLDAESTLDAFLVHGRPDAIRFRDTVGHVVRKAAAAGNGRVRAFGEMVVLLCERGEPEAAAQLEALWNDFATRQPLTLLCSYPSGAFSGRSRGHESTLRDLHSHASA